MKTILPLAVLLLFAFGACQETEYIEVEKLIRDTVKLQTFVDRYFAGTDTVTITQVVEVQVPVPTRTEADTVIVYETKLDTIYLTRVDTLWRTRIVVEHDTVVVRQYSFGDTLVIYGGRTTYRVQPELQPMVTDFFIQAQARGYAPIGGLMTVMIEDLDEVLQAYSYDEYGLTIIVNGNQTVDEMYIPIMRELARQQLGKEYSQDPTSPMYPFFPSNVVRYSNRAQHKAVIDRIFQ